MRQENAGREAIFMVQGGWNAPQRTGVSTREFLGDAGQDTKPNFLQMVTVFLIFKVANKIPRGLTEEVLNTHSCN